MSFESSEEKIERLENILAGVIDGQRKTNDLFARLIVEDAFLMKLLMALKNENMSFMRWLVSTPLITDEKIRKDFLDSIAKMESIFDQLEAAQNAHLKTMGENFPPPEI
jgi:hypothetical protein